MKNIKQNVNSVLRWARNIFTPLAVSFLLYYLYNSNEYLVDTWNTSNTRHLVTAYSLVMLAIAFSPVCTFFVLRYLDIFIDKKIVAEAHLKRLPAKYIPGGIWHTVGRGVDFRRNGVSMKDVTKVIAVEQILILGVASLAGGLLFLLFTFNSSWQNLILISVLLISLVVLPFLVLYFHHNKDAKNINFHWYRYVITITSYVVFWFLLSSAFACYMNAFSQARGTFSFFHLQSIYLISWSIGFMAVFAPQGIGIFEFIASSLINGELKAEKIISLIAGFRVMFVVADMMAWSIYKIYKLTMFSYIKVSSRSNR